MIEPNRHDAVELIFILKQLEAWLQKDPEEKRKMSIEWESGLETFKIILDRWPATVGNDHLQFQVRTKSPYISDAVIDGIQKALTNTSKV